MVLDREVVKRTLDAVPGPLPWYGRSLGNRIYSRGLELEWVYAEDLNASLLVECGFADSAERPVFGIGETYSYPKNLPERRFLLWWQERGQFGMGHIHFRVYDAEALRPIEGSPSAWKDRSDHRIGAPDIASFSLPATLGDGLNRVPLPREFSAGDELLILVNRAAIGMDLCIWRVDTESQYINVLPQRWWNESNLDFGYQWITRVAVESTSGLIVGDGIRINPFVLDSAGLMRAK